MQEYNIAYKNKSTRNKIYNKITYGELNFNSLENSTQLQNKLPTSTMCPQTRPSTTQLTTINMQLLNS
jgi:hypothetical protein